MFYKFELGLNVVEVTKNFAQVARTSTIRQGQVSLKLDSEVRIQAIEANLASTTCKVSGKLSKSIQSSKIAPHITKLGYRIAFIVWSYLHFFM